jgi:hypothetical protein
VEKSAPEVNTFVLVGNKLDLSAKRAVDSHEAKDFASSRGWAYVEASAKSAVNVESIFEELATLYQKNNPPEQGENQQPLPKTQTVFVSRDPKGKSCC